MLRTFTVGFQKVLRVIFYFSWVCLVYLTLSCTVASLKVSVMIVYDVATKILDTEIYPQYNIADLISGITFIVLFSEEKPQQYSK